MRNPGFEEGEKHPAHWQRCDDLTSFWEARGGRGGRCLRIDTRVHTDDYHRRLEEMKLEHPPKPRPQKPLTGNGYGAIGGGDGVPFFSDWIDCKPGTRYRLSVDVRSTSRGHKPKVFVKGYSEIPTEIDDRGKARRVLIRRVTYKIYLDCEGGPDWKTSTIEFCPTHTRKDVKWMKVMLFPYWPAGEYRFDNVKIVEIGSDPNAPRRWKAAEDAADGAKRRAEARLVREATLTIRVLRDAIERYRLDVGRVPSSLGDLVKDPGDRRWAGPYVIAFGKDPWGREYVYEKTVGGFDLFSTGPDGKKGGGDDVR